MIAVNLGGEGEPVDGADLIVNANIFESLAMIRPGFAARLGGGHVAVATSAGDLGLRDACADLIIARHFPIQFDRTMDGFDVEQVAAEAFRIAKPGAALDFSCSSCDLQTLAESFREAGFADIETVPDRYGVRGRKP
ncbi:MAG: hypothetical protein MUF83_20485 [Acidimicrobiales bacterium]|jgi:hypothetical protein|nr:hypothetical protein [Acidimicrobiales bacterium]